MTVDPAIAAAARLSLAVLFAQAAWHKLSDLGAFRRALYAYDLVPDRALYFVSVALPLVEAAVVAALVVPAAATAGGSGAFSLLAVYTAAIALNLARGKRDVDCGCGSKALSPRLGPGLVARNGVALVVAWAAASPVAGRELGLLDAAAVVGASATAGLLWQIANRLLVEEAAHRRLVALR